MFLIAYGLFRLSLENVRNPDIGMPDFPLGLDDGHAAVDPDDPGGRLAGGRR
ncbi:hypothetical protein ACRAWD_21045 [Caulobacter segnis]